MGCLHPITRGTNRTKRTSTRTGRGPPPNVPPTSAGRPGQRDRVPHRRPGPAAVAREVVPLGQAVPGHRVVRGGLDIGLAAEEQLVRAGPFDPAGRVRASAFTSASSRSSTAGSMERARRPVAAPNRSSCATRYTPTTREHEHRHPERDRDGVARGHQRDAALGHQPDVERQRRDQHARRDLRRGTPAAPGIRRSRGRAGASSPTVSPGRWRTALTASSTPGMNEVRSTESCRIVSTSPGDPNSTSSCATRPGSRTACTRTPSTSAPRAPSRPWVVGSGGGVRPARRRAAAMACAVLVAVPLGRVDLALVVQLDDLGGVVEPGGGDGEVLRQHRPEREVRRDRARRRAGRRPASPRPARGARRRNRWCRRPRTPHG